MRGGRGSKYDRQDLVRGQRRRDKKRRFGPEYDVDHTRPGHLQSKMGTSGKEIQLTANYFSFEQGQESKLFQYKVDFSLEEDRTFMKKALLRQHKDSLPQYMFDGSMLLSFHRLFDKKAGPLVLQSTRVNGDGSQDSCRIFIRFDIFS